jgi:hypothetical protein
MANRKAIMKAEIVRRPTIDQRAARRDRREYFFVMALFWLVLPAKRGDSVLLASAALRLALRDPSQ